MPLLNRILQLVNFAKKNDMTQPSEFEPTDIIQHRYLDPQVLVNYIKTLPDKFKDEQITIKVFRFYHASRRSQLTFQSGFGRRPPWAKTATKAHTGRFYMVRLYNLPLIPDQEELDGALQAFVQAERARQDDDGD
jgi:hypothetical protein